MGVVFRKQLSAPTQPGPTLPITPKKCQRETVGWAAWLVFCQGFQVRGCSCEIFSLPLEILKQIDCLVWSRRGPSKTESISTLWNILLGMVV